MDAASHSASSNAAFMRKHAAAVRIGPCGGPDWIDRAIRAAGVPLDAPAGNLP